MAVFTTARADGVRGDRGAACARSAPRSSLASGALADRPALRADVERALAAGADLLLPS